MTSTYYNSLPTSFTSEEQSRLIEALSKDGTLEGVNVVQLEKMLASQDTSVASLEDLAFLYTYLTGSFPGAWEVDLLSPDEVALMSSELSEWADLTTSSDLSGEIKAFLALLSPDTKAMGLSTGLGTDLALTVEEVDEVVNYANAYYEAQQAEKVAVEKDYEGLINLAFSMGSPALALMYIMSGYTDPVTGETSEGLINTISDSQEGLVEQVEDINDELADLMSDRARIDPEDPEANAELANLSSQENILGQNQSMVMQSFTTLQGIMSDTIGALTKIAEMDQATKQRIWS